MRERSAIRDLDKASGWQVDIASVVWKTCQYCMAVNHLTVDAPRMLKGLGQDRGLCDVVLIGQGSSPAPAQQHSTP